MPIEKRWVVKPQGDSEAVATLGLALTAIALVVRFFERLRRRDVRWRWAIGFGLAGVLRGAIAPLGIMIALPIVVATGILQWPAGIRLLPDQTALSLVGTPGYDVTELPPGAAALVLIAWTILAVSAYGIALARRDA